MKVNKTLILILLIGVITSCSSDFNRKIYKSQHQFYKKEIENSKPKNILKAFDSSRKSLISQRSDIDRLMNKSNVFYLIEGYALQNGMIYSTIWFDEANEPICYDSFVGNKVEIKDKCFFDQKIYEAVEKLDTNILKRQTNVLGGAFYIGSRVKVEGGEIISIDHVLFDEPSY